MYNIKGKKILCQINGKKISMIVKKSEKNNNT